MKSRVLLSIRRAHAQQLPRVGPKKGTALRFETMRPCFVPTGSPLQHIRDIPT